MKNALISPNEKVEWLSGWDTSKTPYAPIYTVIGERVADTEVTPFEVAPPLFWVACPDNTVADQWYLDTADNTVKEIPAPTPKPAIPTL